MIPRLRAAALILTAALSAGPAMAGDVLRFTTGDNFPPYTGEALRDGGIATAIVKAVYERMGREIEIHYRPWKRGYEEAKKTDFFATYPYVHSPERIEDFHYSDPLLSFERSLFELSRQPASSWPGDLKGNRVCIPIGYEVPPAVIDRIIDGRLTHIKPSTMEVCFKQLMHGRTDFVLSDRILGVSHATEIFGGEKLPVVVLPPVTVQSAYVIVSKKYPGGEVELRQFNESLKMLHDEGMVTAIINAHIGQN